MVVACADVVLVGEWLADGGIVSAAHLGIDHSGGAAGEEVDLGEVVVGAGVSRTERRGQSLIADVVAAKAVDAGDARQSCDGIGKRRVERGKTVCAGVSGGLQKQIGFELIVHPDLHGLAKAADHDRHRGHHGDCRRQCGHQHRSAPQRRHQAARRQHGFDAERPAQQTGDTLRSVR